MRRLLQIFDVLGVHEVVDMVVNESLASGLGCVGHNAVLLVVSHTATGSTPWCPGIPPHVALLVAKNAPRGAAWHCHENGHAEDFHLKHDVVDGDFLFQNQSYHPG